MSADPVFAPSSTELGGHAWAMYLANRTDSERGMEWVILDWCYAQDPDIPVENKPLAKDGGQHGGYKEIWFTFNDEYSWSQQSFEIKEGRISKKRTVQKDEVLTTIKDVLKNLAKEQIEEVLKKYSLKKD